jgi:hypothetical protein
MVEPAAHPEARGILRQWVSSASVWSATTRHLQESGDMGSMQLWVVALYLCVNFVCLIIEGRPEIKGKPGVCIPGDAQAAASCPIPLDQLHALRTRAKKLRDEVMHFWEKDDTGREISIHLEPGSVTYRSSVGHKDLAFESITRAEVAQFLDTLGPWLHRQWQLSVEEQFGLDEDSVKALDH